jgi:hypothetical protein
MCDVPVFYATTEGQTRRSADELSRSCTSMVSTAAPFELAPRKPGQ